MSEKIPLRGAVRAGVTPAARKELVFYESGHRMPPEYTAKAVSWLTQYLK